MHDGDSLDSGHYLNDVIDINTGIWWHCDNDDFTEIFDLSERVYNKEILKKTTKKGM